jgi:pentatricopeptide repeat protein
MIHSCGANDAFDAAVRVFDLMRAAGVHPNAATYNGVIESLGRAGKLDEMDAHYQQMLREGVVPTVETFTIMIDVYGKRVRLRPDSSLLNILFLHNCSVL